MRSKKNILIDLFGSNVVSREEFLSTARKRARKVQHEKKFMTEISGLLKQFPHIHIDYHCGNKFWVECKCGNRILAECHKVNNAKNSGAPDLIGIAWGVETKHKYHGRNVHLEPSQKNFQIMMKANGIPFLSIAENNADEILSFIKLLKDKLNNETSNC
jgi:hypothetical protein